MIIDMEGDMIVEGRREKERQRRMEERKGKMKGKREERRERGNDWRQKREKCDIAGFEMKERDRSQRIKVV